MAVIVTDEGFYQSEIWEGWSGPGALHLGSDADPEAYRDSLAEIDAIKVDFPSFADGRGFTIAQRLRAMGYTGRLRAVGHVLADQYTMARRVGFNEVEISDDLAARQPEAQWLARADWQAHDYQSRLKAPA